MLLRNPFAGFGFLLYRRLRKQHVFRFNFDGVWLSVRTLSPDLAVVRSYLSGEFEAALDSTALEHRFIVDAGGYIGTASVAFARRFPDAKIVCLEPSLENYKLAEENCAAWPNIDVVNCALAASDGTVALRDRGTGHWGFTTVNVSADAPRLKELHSVRALSVESLLEKYERSGIDLLKLDIEGSEYELLKEAPGWINACGTIVAEIHERISPGATEVFDLAMRGRREIAQSGEKRISVKQ